MDQVYCGLDFHKNISELCFVDSKGTVLERARVTHSKALLLLSNRKPLHVAIEASGAVFDMAQKVEALGHRVTVVNPSQFRAIGVTGKKNDKNDALALATALRVGFLPEVHKKSLYARRLKSLLASRDFVTRSRVNISNHIRGILREYGCVMPKGSGNFWALADKMVEKVECDVIGDVLKSLFAKGAELIEEEKKIAEALSKLTAEDERIKRLMTVPGIGQMTATAIVASIDDVSRFKDAKSFASYIGLVPRESSSGQKIRFGSVTKCGPEMLRRYLIHGARTVYKYRNQYAGTTIEWLARLEKRAGKNKAVVAMAHRNARVCFALLRDGSEFRRNVDRIKIA